MSEHDDIYFALAELSSDLLWADEVAEVLALKLREIKAEAWEEGWRAATDHPNAGKNPYRKG